MLRPGPIGSFSKALKRKSCFGAASYSIALYYKLFCPVLKASCYNCFGGGLARYEEGCLSWFGREGAYCGLASVRMSSY